jgi:hypothetical protein
VLSTTNISPEEPGILTYSGNHSTDFLWIVPRNSKGYAIDSNRFMLVELLVIIAVIAVLVALLLSALAKAKERGVLAVLPA